VELPKERKKEKGGEERPAPLKNNSNIFVKKGEGERREGLFLHR